MAPSLPPSPRSALEYAVHAAGTPPRVEAEGEVVGRGAGHPGATSKRGGATHSAAADAGGRQPLREAPAGMATTLHRFIETNGIRMHVAERGS